MAYSTSNPPQQISQAIAGPSLWLYSSADVHTDVDATDYFSDGDALGMEVNDIVIVADTTTPYGVTLHQVTAVTAGGAATVGAALLA